MPPTPRRESQQGLAASSYVLECKLLRAYTRLYEAQVGCIWHGPTRKAACVALLGGNLAATQVRHAECRLSEVMPELIQRLKPEDQEPLRELLLGESPDLAATVQYLVKMEHWLNHHQDDPRLKVNDDALCRAASIGRLARADPGNFQKKQPAPARIPLGPPLELTPLPPRPLIRAKKRRVYRKCRTVAYPQLALEFPGGGITLAVL